VSNLSVRYATALFELSQERGAVADMLEQTVFVLEALNMPDCVHVYTNPRVKAADKHAFFDAVFANHIHADLLGFLHLTITKNRETFLIPALDALGDMIKAFQNHTTARVVTAVALDAGQITQLTALLSRKLGKVVDLNVAVNPDVIGGLSIQVDGYFIDRTIRASLKELTTVVSQPNIAEGDYGA